MLDRLERMINAMEDPDWAWGPLLAFRPPKQVRMDQKYWLRFWLPLLLASTLIGDLFMPIAWMVSSGTTSVSPGFFPYYLSLFRWFVVRASLAFFIVLGLALLAITWAWNRRADRLQREPIPEPLPEISQEGVWPPAPRI